MTDQPAPSEAGDDLRSTLIACRDRFKEYALSHQAKNTEDGKAKAKRNWEMFDRCCDALFIDNFSALPSFAEGVEAAWRAAWTAEPLPEAPIRPEDRQAFYYGRDCAAAAVRELKSASPSAGREEMVELLRGIRKDITHVVDRTPYGKISERLNAALAKIDAALKDGR